ncbi:MAG: adenylyltransferase/cytidyltransferase family protein [Candidatus Paceibacterota bacterium]
MSEKHFIEHRILFGQKSNLPKRFSSDHETTKELIERYRSMGKKIVLTQGSFDMIHIGHARYLEEAKKHGDILLVGIDSDEKVRSRKGEHRPVVPQEERLEMLVHLRSVDLVTIKEHSDPKWHLIKIVRPDILIITERMDYSEEAKKELEKLCGKIVLLQSQATTSTSARVRNLHTSGADNVTKRIMEKFPTLVAEVFEEVKNKNI